VWLRRLLAVTIVAIAAPYACSPVYRFPAPRPFHGPTLQNPYAQLRRGWQRANLHAHGYAWAGLTNGAQTDADIVDAYHAAGYDIAGVSDYQRISDPALSPIAEYEHGYNIRKRHQLAIGAKGVVWMDFLFWQGLNQKQYILDRLRATAALVSINHPARLEGYTVDDMRYLTGYQLLEVVNGHEPGERFWDAALSAGHLVWGIGGDDIHDLTDRARIGVAWTMINSDSRRPDDIIEALRAGRSYVVYRHGSTGIEPEITLTGVTVSGRTITVTISGRPASIGFVGQNGFSEATVANTMSASYTLQAHDTYIRAIVRTPDMDLYVNPLAFADVANVTERTAEVSFGWTVLYRLAIAAMCVVALLDLHNDMKSRVICSSTR